MRLSQLTTGQKAEVVKIVGHGAFRKRLMEMGFVKGQEVDVLLHAPLRDPIKYRILGYEVSLRRAEADLIEVALYDTNTEIESTEQHRQNTTLENDSPAAQSFSANHNTINIALIGNPNCGKTSLFNNASGAHEHVGNYSGVTVDAKQGTFEYNGYRFNIVDLPGTYSLDSYSPEELYVRRYLKNETPDVIINVVVASNLERNLYLTTELIDMDRKMVIALNMYDELERSGDKIDTKLLGEMIGVPIVPTVSRSGFGTQELWQTIIDVFAPVSHKPIHQFLFRDPFEFQPGKHPDKPNPNSPRLAPFFQLPDGFHAAALHHSPLKYIFEYPRVFHVRVASPSIHQGPNVNTETNQSLFLIPNESGA